MNPLDQLKRLTQERAVPIDTGTVTSIQTGSVTVKTRSGLRTVVAPSGLSLRVGDSVRVQGNVLLSRSTNIDNLPVFRV